MQPAELEPVKTEKQILAEAMAERVRTARRTARVSQKLLCKTAGLKSGHLSHIESGRRGCLYPRRDTINCIVEALKKFGVIVTPDWIMYGAGHRPRRTPVYFKRFSKHPEAVL